jgi:prepilin-type N-terminal cleavage/methylation domain-containing protein
VLRINARRSEGFSLTEIMVAIFIVAILAAIAIPATLAQRNLGVEAAQKSDLLAASAAVEQGLLRWRDAPPSRVDIASGTSQWAAIVAGDEDAAFTGTLSDGTTLTGTIWPDGSYCLQSTVAGASEVYTFRSDTSAVETNTACPTAPFGESIVLPGGAEQNLPGLPGNVVATVVNDKNVVVTWAPPSQNATNLTGYTVKLNNIDSVSVAAGVTTVTFPNLTNGNYTVIVYARNAAGVGAGESTTVTVAAPEEVFPHTHPTEQVTGIMPIVGGGTGASTAAGALTALGASALGHAHSLSDIIGGGTLTVSQGGTGAGSLTAGSYLKGNGTNPVTTQTGVPAADITGTIPVSQGGTGTGTLTSGSYLKGNGTAAVTSQTGIPAADITSGTLGVARGGTGAATLAAGSYLKGAGTGAVTAQTGVPAADITGTLPISAGGTGATTAAGALTALGAASSTHLHDTRYYTQAEVDAKVAAQAGVTNIFDSQPAGSIIAWSTNTAPAGWLMARGQAVSRTTYSALFAEIGTTYGAGNGSTTFNVPDFSGRAPVGLDATQVEFNALNGSGGVKTHSHTASALYGLMNINYSSLGGGVFFDYQLRTGASYTETRRRNISGTGSNVDTHSETNTEGVAIGGSTDAGNNLSPYRVVNYIIKHTTAQLPGDSQLEPRIVALEANSSVTTARIADGAVTTAKLADVSVTAAKIATGAVTTAEILDGAVATADLANLAVTTAKLADSSVTTAKIAVGSIGANELSSTARFPMAALEINGTGTTSLTSTLHPFQIGLVTGANIVMDGNRIQARSNSAAAQLNLNTLGGAVAIGNASSAITLGGSSSTVTMAGRLNATHLPFAYSAGLYDDAITVASGTGGTLNIAFPSTTRFTTPPLVFITAANSSRLTFSVSAPSVTTTGFTVRFDNFTSLTAAERDFQWMAVQMSSGAAAG